MSAPARVVLLDGLPGSLVEAATTYLADMLRECQLVVADQDPESAVSDELRELASSLVPDLEEVRALFAGAQRSHEGDATRIEVGMHAGHAGIMAHLQMQLVQLRLLGRRGELLVPSDPVVTQFLAWVWDESSDQLHGRRPRPYRLREV